LLLVHLKRGFEDKPAQAGAKRDVPAPRDHRRSPDEGPLDESRAQRPAA